MAVSGRFEGSSGPVPDWSLRLNRCAVNNGSVPMTLGDSQLSWSLRGIDMYFARPDAADTEAVLAAPAGGPKMVLVRIPERQRMTVLTSSMCKTFELSWGPSRAEVNDSDVLEGEVRVDCRHPELGHVTGQATFRCYGADGSDSE